MAEIVMQENMFAEEILGRLPVKSLIRFTSVSKEWQRMIRSPEFATKHYATRLSQSQDKCDSVLTICKPAASISILCYDDLALETTFKFRPAVDDQPPRDVIHDCYITNPCNGLFLIRLGRPHMGYGLLLWNPATREVHNVPSHGPYSGEKFLGFGFDPITNDYKIVCFDMREVQLYSLAANSWTQLHGALDNIDTSLFSTHDEYDLASSCNGRMNHWVFTIGFGGTGYTLLSFDMVDEVFVQTPVPLDTETTFYSGFLFSNLYLALCFKDKSMDAEKLTVRLHIWPLPHPKRLLWEKHSVISLPRDLHGSYQMCLWKDKAIVFDQGQLYDISTQQIKSLPTPVHGRAICYTQSLVSIANIAARRAPQQQPAHQEYNDIIMPLSVILQLNEFYDLSFEEEDDDDDDDDDDDSSSTDISPFQDNGTVYIEYDKDVIFYTDPDPEWQSFLNSRRKPPNRF